MDFGTLLHVAKKNSETGKNEGKFYSTKFAPPKKESKDKKLSENIQKFLQKREQEEKERQRVEREKLNNLLSKRDEKSKNKIKKMLKVTKSANKSVLDDAINSEHTAVTMEGPDQPDQDDYGYVSTEANAFYQKYIEKVKDVKEDKGFAPSRPQSLKDLTGTKERVKAAITKEIEDKKNHTRQRISSVASSTPATKEASAPTSRASTNSKNLYDPEEERREEERKKREEAQKKAKSRKPAPPPMDFQALLKLAEKKQHEPINIVVEVKKKEPERLLTSKEKLELEERQREREARERRKREREMPTDRRKATDRGERSKDVISVARMEPNGRIPKLNQAAKSTATSSALIKSGNSSSALKTATVVSGSIQSCSNDFKKPISAKTASSSTSTASSNTLKSLASSAKVVPKPTTSSNLSNATKQSSLSSKSLLPSAFSSQSSASKAAHVLGSNKNSQSGCGTRESPPRDIKTIKARQFPPLDVQKKRQFPPHDVRRRPDSKVNDNRKPQMAQKRRIPDDDDEDEYDSELDDFIDDGDCEEDYSSHIKEIFGYDKSRYRHLDEEDDTAMESNFAQVQREEYISKKIGIKEDLEDMKLEAAEKKRKMMMKKKKT